MNNVFYLIGRITKNLELKSTQNGKSVLRVPIAVQNGKDDTSFIETTLFGKIAETTVQYCKKGDLIGLTGMIKNHNWEDSKGNKHYDYSFLTNKVIFLQTKREETKEELKNNDNDPFADFGQTVSIDDEFLD